jgi:MFS family permease
VILRSRTLLALLAAESASGLGSQMTWLALPWFVLTTTGSPQRMTYVIIAELTPIGLLGMAGGSVAARIGSRATMLVGDAARAPLMAAIPTLFLVDALPFWALLVLVGATGVFFAPYFSAQRTIVPEFVGEAEGDIAQATALFQGAQRLTILLGPPLAGVLISVIGTAKLLYVDAASFALSFALVLAFVPRTEAKPEDETAGTRGVLAGLRFILRDRLLRAWMASFTLVDVGWQALFASMPVLVLHHYGANPRVLGVLIGAFGGGALAGSALAFRLVRRFEGVALACVSFVGQVVFIWALALPIPWEVAAASFAICGVFNPIVNSPTQAVMMLRTPKALRAKTFTAAITLQALAMPLALVVVGSALTHVEVRAVIAAVLVLQTVAVAIFVVAGLAERSALRPTRVVA